MDRLTEMMNNIQEKTVFEVRDGTGAEYDTIEEARAHVAISVLSELFHHSDVPSSVAKKIVDLWPDIVVLVDIYSSGGKPADV